MTTLEKIDKFLLEEAQKKKIEHITALNVFYPSSVGQCIRKAYNEKLNPKVFPVQMYKYFVIGNLTHEWLQKNIYAEGKHEVPFKLEINPITISGRIDTVLDNRILEFKSIGKLDYVKSKPKPEHVEQANIYMKALNIPNATIIYVTKNELEVVEHNITYNEDMYNQTIKYFLELYDYIIKKEEPKPKKCVSPWACEYCKKEIEKGKKKEKEKKVADIML